jgi:hypothetical protein
LGDGTTTDRLSPVVVMDGGSALGGVSQISAGASHTCALLTSGQVRCWGAGSNGRLGHGSPSSSSSPVVVLADSTPLGGVTQISTGTSHTCATLTNGEVRCWGANLEGRLGDGTTDNADNAGRPVRVAGTGSTILDGIAQVSAGFDHTCAVVEVGTVLCWGAESAGQLGHGVNSASGFLGSVVPLQVLRWGSVAPSPVVFLVGVLSSTGGGSTSTTSLSIDCGPLVPRVGAVVTCRVSQGVPSVEILWRAAYNPAFAGEGMTLDEDGAGSFSFIVPAAAVGQVLTVELVDWAAPQSIGVVGGPVPSSVPSGGGPVSVWSLVMLALVGALVVVRRSRSATPALRRG